MLIRRAVGKDRVKLVPGDRVTATAVRESLNRVASFILSAIRSSLVMVAVFPIGETTCSLADPYLYRNRPISVILAVSFQS